MNFLDRFSKNSDVKFHENPSSGSREVPCGQTDGQKDMRKLIVAFGNFANAPTNQSLTSVQQNPSLFFSEILKNINTLCAKNV